VVTRILHALTVGYCERTAVDDLIVVALGLWFAAVVAGLLAAFIPRRWWRE
jgi:hypothetical protein